MKQNHKIIDDNKDIELKQADFDEYAKDYREIHTKNIQSFSGKDSGYFGEYKVRIINQEVGSPKKVKILDLGCGDGLNAVFFEKYFPGMQYYGIDISKECIRQAKKAIQKSNVSFSMYDGKTIPFDDDSFDIILIACVLHHVPYDEHYGLLKECQRVLKERGNLYIFEHNPFNPVTRKIVNTCPFDEDAVLIRAGRMKHLLSELRFHNIKISYTIFFPRKFFFRYLLGIEKYLKCLPGGQYYIRCEKKTDCLSYHNYCLIEEKIKENFEKQERKMRKACVGICIKI